MYGGVWRVSKDHTCTREFWKTKTRTPDTYGWLTEKTKKNKKIKKIDTGAYMSLTKQIRKI